MTWWKTSALKRVQSCSQYNVHEPLKEFVRKIKPFIPRLKLATVAHITGILEITLHLDEDFLDRVASKLLDSLHQARLKDITKIARTCSVLNHRPQVGDKDMFEELLIFVDRRLSREECLQHPSKCVELLAALARMGLLGLDVVAGFICNFHPRTQRYLYAVS